MAREQPLTRLEAIVLGLLIERPAHGYELKARLGPGLPRERLINDGVLVPLLGRLERRGLAEVEEREIGGRPRKVYSALEPGIEAFDEWLAGGRDESAEVDYEIFLDHPMVKLLFASRMSAGQFDEKVDDLLAAARARLEAFDRVPRDGRRRHCERGGGGGAGRRTRPRAGADRAIGGTRERHSLQRRGMT